MTLKVKSRATGEKYDVMVQAVDVNFDGKYYLRYLIGIQGYDEFHFIHAIYDNDKFNEMYEVIKGEQ